ncbi:MAG: phosphatidylserine decarboxylase [Candidatus Heimdallarchaeota archaeon]|nr:phosphatidylserine decarboxylase [Candidatus Heimdallarchaeota archaeon]MCK5142824.1 phosphatidylserine decarboxylase [Candidatus Heimdallarchaeota archaeon]
MAIAKGTKFIVLFLLAFSALCFVLSFVIWYLTSFFWHFIILGLIVITSSFLIWTFRNPERSVSIDINKILAPADGRIMEVEEKEGIIYCLIRMSPFDVHMTRSPIKGKVTKTAFKKGSHWPAYFPNYAMKNQRNKIEIIDEVGNISAIVTQVSGIFARRTVAYVKSGDIVKQGEVIGTIRFGSLTSLEIKSDKKFKFKIGISEVVRAGKTVLAECD